MYELRDGFNSETTGTYIHPRLVNYVAQWCDVKYSILVSMIMDKINEHIQASQLQLVNTKVLDLSQ